MDYTFYIPKNVSTRFELVKGIGIKELIYTGIATIIGVIIAFIINAITKNYLLSVSFVALFGGLTFFFNMKDNNNQSILMQLQNVVRFFKIQKFYKYIVKGDENYESKLF